MHPREELLSAMADGMLSVSETHKVAMHLHDCEECRNTLAAFERNKALFRAMDKPASPPQEFWDNTFRKMRTTEIEKRHPSFTRQWRAAIAAAMGLVAITVVPIYNRYHSNIQISSPPVIKIQAQDTIDADEVSSLVKAHTHAVANQPLSDSDRQLMIANDNELASNDDQTPEAAINADAIL